MKKNHSLPIAATCLLISFIFIFTVRGQGVANHIVPISDGNFIHTALTAPDDTVPFMITISLRDSSYTSHSVVLGLHTLATGCIDPALGEQEMPPTPPAGVMDIRFVEKQCLGQGVALDLHAYTGPTQIDTFILKMQPGDAYYPLSLSWPDLHQFYNGPVRLTGSGIDQTIDVDMLAESTVVITDDAIARLRIIAANPAFVPPPFPVATTGGATEITAHSALLSGLVSSSGSSTTAYFQWGTSTSYDQVTPAVIVNDSIHQMNAVVSELQASTVYHFRLVAQNVYGWSLGNDAIFTTLADSIPLPSGNYIQAIYSDSGNHHGMLEFGYDPRATNCIDTVLGEIEMPPKPPAGILDIRFLDPHGSNECFGQGLKVDIRPLLSSAQADTYRVSFQLTGDTLPIVLSWPNLEAFYSGPVTMVLYPNTGTTSKFTAAVVVDMKQTNTVELNNDYLGTFKIFTQGPRIISPPSDSEFTAYWPFNDPSDDEALDFSGHLNNGSAYAAPRDKEGARIFRRFNGHSSIITVPNPSNNNTLGFDTTEGFIIGAVFRTLGSGIEEIVRKGVSPQPGYDLRLVDGHVQGRIGDDSANGRPLGIYSVTSSSTVNDGEWHEVRFMRAMDGLALLIDNVLDGTAMAPYPNLLMNGADLNIGGWAAEDAPQYFDGEIDEVSIQKIPDQNNGAGLAPAIYQILDVPNDQGKQVMIVFRASAKQGEQDHPITGYSIWRNDVTWTYLGTVPARADLFYSFVAPTLFDSTINDGQHLSYFEVTAHTADPTVFYTSEIRSGFSVDNLAPHAPHITSFMIHDGGVTLQWDPSPDKDIQYYNVYRGDAAGFAISGQNRIAQVSDTRFTDLHGLPSRGFYRVSAVDFSGNESPAGMEMMVTGVGSGTSIPAEFNLRQNYPNPFNPTTTIAYDLPKASPVTLTIYNILGEEVATLRYGGTVEEAGTHEVFWNAQNIPSGIYVYKLTAGTFVDVKKMALVR